MKVNVLTLENKEAGSVELSDSVFGLEVRGDLLARVVNWQLAKRRAGTHKVKGRSEIAGSTAKIYRQKGTGNARHGSKRATQFRGGGTVFGPTPRDHGHKLNKKVRILGLKHALSSKVGENLIVVDELSSDGKTKSLKAALVALGVNNALFIDGVEVNENFARAAANIPNVDVLPCQGANVYDILRRNTLVLSKAAVEALEARLK